MPKLKGTLVDPGSVLAGSIAANRGFVVTIWDGPAETYAVPTNDVREVVRWADKKSKGRAYEIFANVKTTGQPESVRISGFDPTDPDNL